MADPALYSYKLARSHFANWRDVSPVFIASRQVIENVPHRLEASLGKGLSPAWAHTFEKLGFGVEGTYRHRHLHRRTTGTLRSMPDHKPGGNEPSEEELERRFQALLGPSDDGDHFHVADSDQPDQIDDKFKAIDEKIHLIQANKDLRNQAIDDEFEEKLRALEEKAHRSKAMREVQQRKVETDQRSSQEDSRALALGLSIAYTIIGMPLLGTAVGWGVDRQLGTHYWMGMMTLAGATLGVAVAIYKMSHGEPRP